MAGLVPAIHVLLAKPGRKTWMPATSAGITPRGGRDLIGRALVRQNIEMEAAVNGRAVAPRKIARLRGLIAPLSQHRVIDPRGQWTGLGGRAENHARALARRAGDLPPKLIELLLRHPILSVEQDVAVERSILTAPGVCGDRTVEAFHAMLARPQRCAVRL